MTDARTLHGPSRLAVPEGDTHDRLVCADCGYIAYENPKVVAACVVLYGEQYLLCRRAIEPRRGYWTIPGGYLEQHETTADGARREALEEAECTVEIDGFVGIFEIPRVSQIYVVHRGRLATPDFGPGAESSDVALFDYADIPWDDLAFSSVTWALQQVHAGAPTAGALAPDPAR